MGRDARQAGGGFRYQVNLKKIFRDNRITFDPYNVICYPASVLSRSTKESGLSQKEEKDETQREKVTEKLQVNLSENIEKASKI
ncbi:MAG: hypothetical protein QG646_3849 [Euryarchaeota archaeon]|nr:hypothetical protein [Euryarchaeota archaeon]